MIRRGRSASYSAEQDSALRAALFAAAESVEPGDDGLAKIRSKIIASQAGRAKWRFGVRAAGEPWWRSFLPPRGWLPAVAAAVADRFRPDPNRAGWFGWLRPAAAVGTGLFVVTAASWAVAALPAAIAPNGRTGGSVRPPGPTNSHHPKHPRTPGFTSSGNGPVGPSGQSGGKQGGGGGVPLPTGTASCSPTATPSTTPSGTPSTGGTPTDGGSPTPTDGGTSTSTDSTSPASQDSSTDSPTPGAVSSAGSTTDPASQPAPGSAALRPAGPVAPMATTSPQATGKVLISWGPSAASGRQLRGEVVRATLMSGTKVSQPPSPPDTPLPAASPTFGVPGPSRSGGPTGPPIPCP